MPRLLQRLRRLFNSKTNLEGDFNERGPAYQRYSRIYLQKGEADLLATLRIDGLSRKEESLLLLQLVEESGDARRQHTLPLANRAWKLHAGVKSARTLAAGLHATGAFSEAIRVLQSSNALEKVPGSWQWLSKELQFLAELATTLPAIPPKADRPAYTPRSDALLWVAPGSIAFESDTPAVRIYEMAQATLSRYPEALVITPPGYPRRRNKVIDASIGSLAHQHVPFPADFEAEGGPLAWSVRHFEQLLQAHRPVAVIAASDLFSSLPALIAARRLGIPYLLDMSRRGSGKSTELCALEQKLQTLCAAHADLLIHPELTEATDGAVAIPPSLFLPPHVAPRLTQAAFTLGVILPKESDITPHALLEAVAPLRTPPHLEVVGDLPPDLSEKATALGLSPDAFSFGPLPPTLRLREWMSRLDAIVLPSGVSDYRFVEAFALGLAVITTDPDSAPAPAEGVPKPLCIASGNVSALAEAITSLVTAPDLREQVRAEGRQWAAAYRIGPNAFMPLVNCLHQLAATTLADAPAAAPSSPPSLPVTPSREVMLLTRRYPAPGDLYNYAFVHTRTRGYARHDLPVDVYKVNPETPSDEMEHEGIRVISCDADIATQMAGSGKYRLILVHFLSPYLWEIIRRHLDEVKVIIWVHCVEVQSWWRRGFEWETESAEFLFRRKNDSAEQTAFWRRIFLNPHPNLHFVFVSQYFAGECFEDIGVTLPKEHYSVIHNLIDGDFYTHHPKTAAHRLRLLSIRSYHNRKYANDLTVGAILELSRRPFFHELEFCLMGDGALFNALTEPLRKFDNVTIKRGFLPEPELITTFAEHGVLLTPTRMDAQGVSRDEAMASGLVPITSNVGAIPEFVDAGCGIVTEPEDPIAIADAVEYLYHHPEEYLKLSAAAAARVRGQSGPDQTLLEELRLIRAALG